MTNNAGMTQSWWTLYENGTYKKRESEFNEKIDSSRKTSLVYPKIAVCGASAKADDLCVCSRRMFHKCFDPLTTKHYVRTRRSRREVLCLGYMSFDLAPLDAIHEYHFEKHSDGVSSYMSAGCS